jgi:hypothetical protein
MSNIDHPCEPYGTDSYIHPLVLCDLAAGISWKRLSSMRKMALRKYAAASLRRATTGNSKFHACFEEVKMNRFKIVVMLLVVGLVALVLPSGVSGQNWNKRTKVVFSGPVEIPGVGAQVLPAGTYYFRLLDSASDRHIVQIFNEREDHVFATILAIPNWRLKPTSETVMTFRERAAGEPQAVRSWFYPGDNFGQEFVYPKMRAIELAKLTEQPVLAMPTELAEKILLPIKAADDPAVITLKQAPIEAVKPTGEVVPMAYVVEPPPARMEPVNTSPSSDSTKSLPHTASPLPFLGLIGLVALATGIGLSLVLKRTA